MCKFASKILILITAVFSIAGCTRTADRKALTDASVAIKQTVTDPQLNIKPVKPLNVQSSLKLKNAQFSTVEYFRLIDSLQALSSLTMDEQIGGLARALYESFYANENNFTRTTLSQSVVSLAVVGEGEPVIRKETAILEKDLKVTVQKISALLKGSSSSFAWPKKLKNLDESLMVLDHYVNWLSEQIPGLKLSRTMELSSLGGLQGEYGKFRPKLVSMIKGLNSAKTLAQSLTAVRNALKALNVKLKAAQASKIREAEALAVQIASVDQAQDALTLLVMVWRITPPQDRGSFKAVSPEMYDFFQDKDDSQLDCLAKRGCLNPVLGISKLVIFRKLEEYGLEKLTAQIDKAARDTILSTAKQEVTSFLPQIPTVVTEQLIVETNKYLALIKAIQKDVVGFGQTNFTKWADAKFNQPLRGLEVAEVNVSLTGGRDISVGALKPAGRVLRTGAATIGASLSLAHQFLPEADGGRMRAAVMEPIMKLMAMGGFRAAGDRLYPSFQLALDGDVSELFDIKKLMAVRTSFAIPDQFIANASFMMDRKNVERTVSVGAQAELLKGISRTIRFHRDWERNQYDLSIGAIQISELLTEFPGGETISNSLFPKDIVFALSLGNAGALLQNMILDLSPAFLLLDKGELLWGNQYNEIKGGKVSTVAGLVSIFNGQKVSRVKTVDIARYVLALDEFMGATEGMEQTASSVLKAPTDEGRSTVITDLVEIRKKLMLLQMGLTNYLVYVAQQKGGGFATSFQLTNALVPEAGPFRLEEQVLSIRALLASATRLELPLFRIAALDAFYNLNRSFFDPERQFYASEVIEDGKPGKAAAIQEVALTLLAGQELAAHMPAEARSQWERLSAPWFRALQEL